MKFRYFCLAVILAVFCPLGSLAQEVLFQEKPFAEILRLAVQEQKPVFIDFYTDWCGPCKTMSNTVFKQEPAAGYLNDNFINVKLNAEKGEGQELAGEFEIKAYPTYIILNHQGEEIYRFSGSMTGEKFVETISKGIDPEWSPAGLTRRYGGGERTPRLVRDYAMLSMGEGDEQEGFRVIDDYFAGLRPKQRTKPENFFIFKEFTMSSSDERARYLYDNKKDFVKANGRAVTEELLARWLRMDLAQFFIWREPKGADVNRENFFRVRETIRGAGFADMRTFDHLFEIAEIRLGGDALAYLDACRRLFPKLPERDQLLVMLNLENMRSVSRDAATAAAALIDEYIDGFESTNRRILSCIAMGLRGEKEYVLAVELEGSMEGTALIMQFKDMGFVSDTVRYTGGSFRYSRAVKDTVTVSIRLIDEALGVKTANLGTNYPTFGIMVVPGETARLKASVGAGELPRITWLGGGKTSADYIRLYHELNPPDELSYAQLMINNIIAGGDIRDYPEEYRAYATAQKAKIMGFVRSNPQSYITAMEVLNHYGWFDENEVESIYASFPENVRNTPYGRAIRGKLAQNPDARIGMPAPRFVKKDMNGAEISLDLYAGKYVLLDFWGTWCGPCRDSHPHMVELHRRFGDRVEFIHIAQENGRDMDQMRLKWEEAIKEDSMGWTQILNNEGQEEFDVVKMYHISAFPTKILIGPDGAIIDRYAGAGFDTSEALQLKLSEIVNR